LLGLKLFGSKNCCSFLRIKAKVCLKVPLIHLPYLKIA
jgi:hypothetical protein